MTDISSQDTIIIGSEPASRLTWLPKLCFILILVVAVAIRWRLHILPLERDEGEYAYMGQLLLSGGAPYRDAYNMKYPGTYAAYAVIMSVFGQTPGGIRIGLILVNLATAGLVFGLARKLFDQTTAFYASALFLVLSLCPGMLAVMAHATHFVILFATAGLWFLVSGLQPRNPKLLLLAGLALGMAVLMKQQACFFVLFAVLYAAYGGPGKVRERLGAALAVLSGAMLPIVICFLLVVRSGGWAPFWFWTVTYAVKYASTESLKYGAIAFGVTVASFAPFVVPWLLGLVGLILVLVGKRHRAFVLGCVLAAILGICPGLYFRAHYFIIALPIVAITGGVSLALLDDRLARVKVLSGVLRPAVLLSLLFSPIVLQRNVLLFLPLDKVMPQMYGAEFFAPAITVGQYIRENSTPADKIAVFGSEPELYFYAHRRSASGYLYTYSLMENQPYAAAMQRQMEGEIERAHPKFLIDVEDVYSWIPSPASDMDVFKWFDGYVKGFHPVCVVSLRPRPSIIWHPKSDMVVPVTEIVILYQTNHPVAAREGRVNEAAAGAAP